MALRDVHSGRKTSRNIHATGVQDFRRQVGDDAYLAIEAWLDDLFSQQEWVNTTFVAPQNWSGTPLQCIWENYSKIADEKIRHSQSAMMYGCIVYSILFDRPETYLFHRHEGLHTNETRPYGLTYRRAD